MWNVISSSRVLIGWSVNLESGGDAAGDVFWVVINFCQSEPRAMVKKITLPELAESVIPLACKIFRSQRGFRVRVYALGFLAHKLDFCTEQKVIIRCFWISLVIYSMLWTETKLAWVAHVMTATAMVSLMLVWPTIYDDPLTWPVWRKFPKVILLSHPDLEIHHLQCKRHFLHTRPSVQLR